MKSNPITTLIIGALALTVVFASCSQGEQAALTGDEEITMENIDEYLGNDARYIDLRDFNDMFSGGYIAGFETVPFFQYLEGRALVRNNGWEFSEADVADEVLLENVFGDKEDVIILMCGSGTRAGYTKEALESVGYTKVINAGGIRDYSGENKILGDGEYDGTVVLPDEVTMANIDNVRDRPGAKYVDLRNEADMYTGGYIDGFEIVSFFEYLEGNAVVRNNGWEFSDADVVHALILENIFGDKDREVFLMCGSGTRAAYTKEALESIGYTAVYNAGGIRDYSGDYKIFGDESFTLTLR